MLWLQDFLEGLAFIDGIKSRKNLVLLIPTFYRPVKWNPRS